MFSNHRRDGRKLSLRKNKRQKILECEITSDPEMWMLDLLIDGNNTSVKIANDFAIYNRSSITNRVQGKEWYG